MGDAGRTQQFEMASFGPGTELVWAASNFRFKTTSKPIVTGQAMFATVADGQIVAVDLTSGRVIWSVSPPAGEEMYGDPVLHNGVLYHLTPGLKIVGLDAATGERTFSFDIKEGGTVTQPVIVDGQLVVATSAGGGQMIILDLASETARLFPIGLPVGLPSRLAVGDGKVFVNSFPSDGTPRYQIAAFDLATSRKLWAVESDTVGAFQSDLLYADGIVFAAPTAKTSESRSPIAAIDAVTGQVLWDGIKGVNLAGEPLYLSPVEDAIAYAQGRLVVEVTGGVSVVDPRTGIQQWTAGLDQFDQFQSLGVRTPDWVLSSDGVITTLLRSAAADEFLLVGLDVTTGAIVSEVRTGIRALDATGQGDLSLIESPAQIVAGGSTLIAWFGDARVIAGFIASATS